MATTKNKKHFSLSEIQIQNIVQKCLKLKNKHYQKYIVNRMHIQQNSISRDSIISKMWLCLLNRLIHFFNLSNFVNVKGKQFKQIIPAMKATNMNTSHT